ncbi:hypothetical protein [Vibrio sp. TRT 29B02]|uniref:hypothetical protein n=1 Tax=Vibrio sp. TRT 29B02 TaxID=3418508 RepID=UPI002F812D11
MDRKSEPAILTMFFKLSMFNFSIFVSIDNLFLYQPIFQSLNYTMARGATLPASRRMGRFTG